jgi:hypothetical protein
MSKSTKNFKKMNTKNNSCQAHVNFIRASDKVSMGLARPQVKLRTILSFVA